MYVEQGFKGLHEWWRYIVGLVIVVIGVIIGQMPFGLAVIIKMKMMGDTPQQLDQTQMLAILDSNLGLFLMLLTFAAGLGALFLVVKFLHHLSLKQLTTSRPKIDWKRVFFIFLLWGIISSGFILIEYWMAPEDYVLNFKPLQFAVLCLIAIIMIPLQTAFEEYLFRGYLMQGIGVIFKNKWLPLLITSVTFGLLHIANPEVDKLGYTILVYYIGTGFFLGIMTLMDEGLELSLGFHAANNLFTALLVTADWTAFQTYSVLKDVSEPGKTGLFEIFIPVFVVFPILLFILSKRYKWTNWKDKLFGQVIEPQQTGSIDELGQST
ncbi:CPBP family intramembrane glutamic endopeptidase [Gaetbulibacter aestuarii]|uniref:Lysostaphin resistance A-like protein n=1 Tax=Gaetbulibacter aestuarii TaxID=1502358 RepID=A0ABW7N3G9_9FLAO